MSTWIRKHLPINSISDKSKPSYNINFIADYSNSRRLSFSEVEQAVRKETDKIGSFKCVPVQPFNTVEAGFVLRQLALESPPKDTFFYVNVAPRKDDEGSRERNEGEELVYIELDNGVKVVATASGYTLSFIQEEISKVWSLNVAAHGSQFRSRDTFPEAVAKVLENDKSILSRKIQPEIPEPPSNIVAYVDGFGNIKTGLRKSETSFSQGKEVNLEIGDICRQATLSDGIFHVDEGELVFAPGSSGGEDPFMEVVLRGGSAAKKFDNPEPGEKVQLN